MKKQSKNSVIFWPKPMKGAYTLQYWGNNAAKSQAGRNGWMEPLGRFLLKECKQHYVTAKTSYLELGLPF